MSRKRGAIYDELITIRHGELEFIGRSGAGYHTHIACKALGLAFDIGCCTLREVACRHVLLSHVHQDHALGALRHFALRNMLGQRPSRIILPSASAPDFRAAMEAFGRLEKRDRGAAEVLIPAEPGQTFQIGRGRRVEVFHVHHTVDSIGFRVIQEKNVLKPEFQGLPGPEIGAKVRAGIAVKDRVSEALVTYIGDSDARTLDDQPEVLESRVVILESTYLHPDDRMGAAERGHLHIEDIAERAALFRCERLILKHFSLKYNRHEIKELVDAALPEDLRARTALLI